MESHHVIREQRILDQIRTIDENKDQIEAREESGTQFKILRHCFSAVVVAADRIRRRQDRRSKLKGHSHETLQH